MLVLGRKVGEEIFIGENIRLVVVSVRGGQVRLGLEALEKRLFNAATFIAA